MSQHHTQHDDSIQEHMRCSPICTCVYVAEGIYFIVVFMRAMCRGAQ